MRRSAQHAAKRAPGTFQDPGRLDLTREVARGAGHIAYGHGAHPFIGAALANLQTEVILEQLLPLRGEGLTLAVDRDAVERVGFAGEGDVSRRPAGPVLRLNGASRTRQGAVKVA
ncbi:hypothetical protein [Streptomyces sp. R41]|uniref:Cytochrome n=1 Tax=Streptomyces sp. R41 TaxID=3238632 RepID=A0AB39RIZ2_9ACTN